MLNHYSPGSSPAKSISLSLEEREPGAGGEGAKNRGRPSGVVAGREWFRPCVAAGAPPPLRIMMGVRGTRTLSLPKSGSDLVLLNRAGGPAGPQMLVVVVGSRADSTSPESLRARVLLRLPALAPEEGMLMGGVTPVAARGSTSKLSRPASSTSVSSSSSLVKEKE